MAAIGTVWGTLTWPDDIWAEHTWGAAVEGEDFTAQETRKARRLTHHAKATLLTRTYKANTLTRTAKAE